MKIIDMTLPSYLTDRQRLKDEAYTGIVLVNRGINPSTGRNIGWACIQFKNGNVDSGWLQKVSLWLKTPKPSL